MSDKEATNQAVEPSPGISGAVEVAAVGSASVEAPKAQDNQDPKWLPERLERERRAILKQLGVEKVEDAKTAIAKLKEIQQQQMTEQEKLRTQVQELEVAAKDLDQYRDAVSALATASMNALSEDQKSVVMDLAGDSPVSQLRVIERLKPTWVKQTGIVAAAPVSTSPPASAPKQVTSPEASKRDTWLQMKKDNPVLAAEFYLAHSQEIIQSKQ